MQRESTTQELILEAGKQEFLENGFQGSSLRKIAKRAGVTTGAVYGYYQSKEDLFEALVQETYQTFMRVFQDAQDRFAQLPQEEQLRHLGILSANAMEALVYDIYDQFDAFRLLLCCAQGTKYEQFIHELSEMEVEATHRFMQVLRDLGYTVPKWDPWLEHILVSAMFSGFFEIVVHEMPLEQAIAFTRELNIFYTAGWKKIMGL